MEGTIYLGDIKEPEGENREPAPEPEGQDFAPMVEEGSEREDSPPVSEESKADLSAEAWAKERSPAEVEAKRDGVKEGLPSAVERSKTKEGYRVVSTLQGGLSEPIRSYINKFRGALRNEKQRATTPIVVDELASKLAKFYEKIRRVIDWKEEHLMRRSIIERILKRRLISEISGAGLLPDADPEQIAEPLVMELIRSGYFENGKIPKEKIGVVQGVLEKYVHILRNSPIKNGGNSYKSKKQKSAGIKKKVNFYNWILEVASCEVEEVLDAPLRENALMEFMTDCLVERIKLIPENKFSKEDAYIQAYISVHQTLYNLDESITVYNVLKYKYPNFFAPSQKDLDYFSDNIESVWNEIMSDLSHKSAHEFYKIAEKFDAPYLILGDVFNKFEKAPEDIEEKLLDTPLLNGLVEGTYKKRLETLKSRLLRSAIFSTLSIFVAGGVSLFIFEVPIANWIHGSWSPWALVADIVIPTALMFLLIWAIKPPSEDNLERIKEEIEKIVKYSEETDVYEVKLVKKRRRIMNFLFWTVYLAGGFGALYLTYIVFRLAKVPWTSLYINTANVAVVVFAAMVIRQRAKELTVEEKDNFIEFLLDFFSIPLARIGLWLSTKWKEYNIVSVFFSTLVDIPFSSLVETVEGWRNFIKEKRSDIH